jgi:hypothetical protein
MILGNFLRSVASRGGGAPVSPQIVGWRGELIAWLPTGEVRTIGGRLDEV